MRGRSLGALTLCCLLLATAAASALDVRSIVHVPGLDGREAHELGRRVRGRMLARVEAEGAVDYARAEDLRELECMSVRY